jgi:hypothetical protein
MVDGSDDHKDADAFSYFKNSYWSLSLLHYLPGVIHEHAHAILSKVIDYNKRQMREAVEEIDIVTRSYFSDFVTLHNRPRVFLEECLSDIVSASLFGEAYLATLLLEIVGIGDSYLFLYHIPSLSPKIVPWWVRLKVARDIVFPREVPVNSFIGQLDRFLRRFHTDMLAACHEEYYEDGMSRFNYDRDLCALIADICLDIFGKAGKNLYPGASSPLEIGYEGDMLVCRCENVSKLFDYRFFERKLGFSPKDKKVFIDNLFSSAGAKYSGDYNLSIEYVLWMFHLCSLYDKNKRKDVLSLSSADAFHSMAGVFIEGPSFFKRKKHVSENGVTFEPPEGSRENLARAVLFIKWRWDEPFMAVSNKPAEKQIDLITKGIHALLTSNKGCTEEGGEDILAVEGGFETLGVFSALIFSEPSFSGRKFYHKWPPSFSINGQNIPYFSERMVLRLYMNVLSEFEPACDSGKMEDCRPRVNAFIQIRLRSTRLYKNSGRTRSTSQYIPPIEEIMSSLRDMWRNGDKIYTCLSWSQVCLLLSARTLQKVFEIKAVLQGLGVIDRTQTTLLYPSNGEKYRGVSFASLEDGFSATTKVRLNRTEAKKSKKMHGGYDDSGATDVKMDNLSWCPGVFDHHIRWETLPGTEDILRNIQAINKKYNGDWVVSDTQTDVLREVGG